MLLLYNILQFALLLVFFPLLTLFVAGSSKYRDRIPARLGFGIASTLASCVRPGPTLWIHALSVGEVTSAVPLVHGLRERYPAGRIVVSVTTRTGRKVADSLLGSVADCIIDGPIDLLPVVQRFLSHIHPDLFILVETDFWPNLLACLNKRSVPALLVNGRVSEKSMKRYRQLGFFFLPMFQCFSFLSMQTLRDKEKMVLLGVAKERLPILGNLKFATRRLESTHCPEQHINFLTKDRILLIAGSTHPGEEQLLIDSYCRLRRNHPKMFLVVAPRDPKRAHQIVGMAQQSGLRALLRSSEICQPSDIFILDTIGELLQFYAIAHIAFVGGSLVKKGGHNPIEPAAMGIPVLFGPHMEDFSEIAASLIKAGGAVKTLDQEHLMQVLSSLLENQDQRLSMGKAAEKCVLGGHNIIANHLELIEQLL